MNNDQLNDLYTSKNSSDILKFYDHFQNTEQLITWIKNRKSSKARIYEVKGKNDIIVVIPTSDYNSKFAQNCRKNIFNGMHIIFVESGGRSDKYFNYSRNVNKGLNYALKYKPDYIIMSSDDMVKIDDISILRSELSKIKKQDPDINVIFASEDETKNHSYETIFARPKAFWKIARQIIPRKSKNMKLLLQLEKKFQIEYYPMMAESKLRFLYETSPKILHVGDFCIFSYKYIKALNGKLFDENFINGSEDYDLDLRILISKEAWCTISFKIGSEIGGTLGTNFNRHAREILNRAYFTYKIEKQGINIT